MPYAQTAPDAERRLECDLVMKGGITSGIVYAPLVLKLHRHGYAFRSIGGTSAGAIAAAVAAAAEHGKRESDSFERLERDVQDWLGADSNLRRLFQPERATEPLMNTLFGYSSPALAWLRWPPLKAAAALLLHDTLAFLAGGALGALAALAFTWLVSGGFEGVTRGRGLVGLALFALLGSLVFCAAHFYYILKDVLPANGFGLCTGRGRNLKVVDETALTDWLFARINDLAGMGKGADDPPLTYGDIWGLRDAAHERGRGRRIDLRMVTSDLSQNQPYVLPFEHDLFIFREREMLRYFPPGVVEHMVARARECRGLGLPDGYHFLPKAKDLPVIFTTRLSLSFPVLISMVPLYTISPGAFPGGVGIELVPEGAREPGPDAGAAEAKMAQDEADEVVVLRGVAAAEGGAFKVPESCLQRNWFSDGGICSNFPIHFFDVMLPSRPTFGVNLTSQLSKGEPQGDADATAAAVRNKSCLAPTRAGRAERPAEPAAFEDDVYLPKANEILPPEWININGLAKFLETVFRTAQNYRDNMQAMLPSYRERIVQIRLTDDEGGLNLNMSKEIIEAVSGKGGRAGDELLTRFDMRAHQWVRFRVLMNQMERSLYDLRDAFSPGSFYDQTIRTRPLDPSFPYQRPDAWLDEAEARLDEIGCAIDEIRRRMPEVLFAAESPQPEPVLRVTPQI